MGNSMGLPTLPVEDINRIATEITTTFVPIYTKQYSLSLVKHIQKERSAPPKRYYLTSPPPADEPLKTGYLTKQGEVRKNWKKRFFVALNEKDNYDVCYYVDEAAAKANPAKPKGRINLCWYEVQKGDEPNSIVMKPWWSSDRRRTWHIRCENDEEVKAWMDTFQIAARKAEAPLNPDPVMKDAFQAAYRETRWSLGEWGWYYYAAPEAKQLSMLIADRCERDCMGPVYAKISGRMESMIRKKVQETLDSTIGGVVGTAWNSVSSKISDSAPTLRTKVEGSVGPVVDKQQELKGKVASSISGVLTPAVNAAAAQVVPRLTGYLLAPLLTAQQAAIDAFITEMQKLLPSTATASGAGAAPVDDAAWKKGIADFTRDTYWYWGVLHDAVEHIRDFVDHKPSKTATVAGKTFDIPVSELTVLLHGVEIWRIGRNFEDGLRALARKAAFTLQQLTKEDSVNKEAALAKVVSLYIHDAKMQAYEEIHNVFETILLTPIRKEVLPAIQSSLTPLKDAIPEAMASFLDLDEVVEEILEESIGQVVDASVVPETATIMEPLDASKAKVAVTSAAFDFRQTLTSGLRSID